MEWIFTESEDNKFISVRFSLFEEIDFGIILIRQIVIVLTAPFEPGSSEQIPGSMVNDIL